MASSFIKYKDNGFWTNDSIVESFQLLLFEEIQYKFGNNIKWLNDYKKELALQSLPLIYGGMSMCFNETLTDENRTKLILSLIDNIKLKINTDNNFLVGDHLNTLRRTVRKYLVEINEYDWSEAEISQQISDNSFKENLPVNEYEHGFSLLKKLVAGEITFKADSVIDY